LLFAFFSLIVKCGPKLLFLFFGSTPNPWDSIGVGHYNSLLSIVLFLLSALALVLHTYQGRLGQLLLSDLIAVYVQYGLLLILMQIDRQLRRRLLEGIHYQRRAFFPLWGDALRQGHWEQVVLILEVH
jgi:hypothetical protein